MSTRNISRYICAYAYVRFLEWKLLNFCDIDCFYRIFKINRFVQSFICPKVSLSKRSFVQKCVCPIVRLSKSEQIQQTRSNHQSRTVLVLIHFLLFAAYVLFIIFMLSLLRFWTRCAPLLFAYNTLVNRWSRDLGELCWRVVMAEFESYCKAYLFEGQTSSHNSKKQ